MPTPIYRLTEACELRGLRASELAEKIGVSRQSVQKYEAGTQNPSPATLARICTELNFPLSFFTVPHTSTPLDDRPIYFRELKQNLDKYRKMSRRWLSLLVDRVHAYEEYVDLPEPNLPNLDIPDFTALTEEDIDVLAEETRRFWGLGDGPISNLTRLLENNGFVICHKSLGVQELDACSVIVEGRPYILANTARFTCSRLLANLAHELGHVVLHQAADKAYLKDANHHERMEHQAWRFASSFLMPPAVFLAEVGAPSLSRFELLKQRWRTSIAAMIMHCYELSYITDEKRQHFFRELSRKKQRKIEPLDDVLPIEKPSMLFECEQMIAEFSTAAKDMLFQESALSEQDYIDLISAPEGYFSPVQKKPLLRLLPC